MAAGDEEDIAAEVRDEAAVAAADEIETAAAIVVAAVVIAGNPELLKICLTVKLTIKSKPLSNQGFFNSMATIKSLKDLLPDPEIFLSLEPEELAGYLLEYLNVQANNGVKLNRYNFRLPHTVQDYPPQFHDNLLKALMEAWIWLEREGMLAPLPGSQGEWVFITRRGRKILKSSDLGNDQKMQLLPKFLHPKISQRITSSFLRGEYDIAVFLAFKEVEMAVREAGGFQPQDVGTDLMRKAFHEVNGPLSDKSLPPAEQQAIAHLFAGAIGYAKNPISHRQVVITDSVEAIEMITVASHLMRIIDSKAT